MCVLLVQVNGAIIFRFVNIKEELRSQILLMTPPNDITNMLMKF